MPVYNYISIHTTSTKNTGLQLVCSYIHMLRNSHTYVAMCDVEVALLFLRFAASKMFCSIRKRIHKKNFKKSNKILKTNIPLHKSLFFYVRSCTKFVIMQTYVNSVMVCIATVAAKGKRNIELHRHFFRSHNVDKKGVR